MVFLQRAMESRSSLAHAVYLFPRGGYPLIDNHGLLKFWGDVLDKVRTAAEVFLVERHLVAHLKVIDDLRSLLAAVIAFHALNKLDALFLSSCLRKRLALSFVWYPLQALMWRSRCGCLIMKR